MLSIKGKKCIVLLSFLFICTLIYIHPVSAATHSLTLTSSGSQDINISASAGTAISSDSINVSTTCRYGYNFTLSTSVSNNNLYLNGDISNNASGTYFSPVDGTTALNSSTNKWGYYYNSSASNTPTSTSIFSPVPTLSSPATIKTPLTTPASSNINDSFKIYYGVNSAPSMSVGTYKMIPDTNNSNNDGTIVYTTTIADACTQYTVHYNPTGTNMGTSITGTGTVADQTMYEGVATNLTNSYFTGPTVSGTTYYFTGWNTAQDGSGTAYTRGQSVTDLTTVGNTITLYAQWTDCPGNRICYSANGTGITGEMGNQSVTSSVTSATLYAPNFKRDNYGFAAWNTKADGTGTNYGPNGTIEFTVGQYSTGGLRLYAKWIASAGNMQGWACPNNTNMPIGTVTALKDTRDNDVYAVAKLADGKCWMIENLRLADKDSNNNDIDLDSTNTHNPSTPLNNSWYYENQQGTLTTSNHLSATSDPTSTNPDTAWCYQINSSDCINQSMLATNNTTLYTSNTASSYSTSSNVYSYGNYYNWYSATAGHGTYNKYDNTSGDICPAGWHLPTGEDATGEFGLLDIALGGTGAHSNSSTTPTGTTMSLAYRTYPNNYVYAGVVYGASIINRSSYGYYWSASGTSSSDAYGMYLYSAEIYPGMSRFNKYLGRMVRCIAGN